MSPTEKQITLVENMCKVLGINNFPFSSKQYTKQEYSKFIKSHYEEYREVIDNAIYDEDWCFETCLNDVWCEEY